MTKKKKKEERNKERKKTEIIQKKIEIKMGIKQKLNDKKQK